MSKTEEFPDIATPYWVWTGYNWIPGGGGILFPLTVPVMRPLSMAVSSDGEIALGLDNDGNASTCQHTQVTNNGTTNAYPIIVASGPGRWYSLENHTTGNTILFDLVLGSGETASLNLMPGQKTLVSSAHGNIINKVLPGSDIVTFHLIPGDNDVTVFLNDATDSGSIIMTWAERNWSIDI